MLRFTRHAAMAHVLLIAIAAAQKAAADGCAYNVPILGEAFFDSATETARFEALRASASPRIRVLAAGIDFMPGDPQAVPADEIAEVVARATRDAPDDAFVQWQAVRTPWQEAQCEPLCAPDLALARLLQLEPDNAAVWLIPLARARMRNDETAIDEALAHAAAATRADDHFIDALVAWREAYSQSQETGVKLPLVSTVGMGESRMHALVDALQRRAFTTDSWNHHRLNESCEADAASSGTWQRLGWCALIARQLAKQGASFAMREAGLFLLDELEAPGVNHEAWKQERWLLLYSASPVDDPRVMRESPDDVLADWDNVPTEIAASERRLRRLGRPLHAPAGWFGGFDIDFDDTRNDTELAAAQTPAEAKLDAHR